MDANLHRVVNYHPTCESAIDSRHRTSDQHAAYSLSVTLLCFSIDQLCNDITRTLLLTHSNKIAYLEEGVELIQHGQHKLQKEEGETCERGVKTLAGASHPAGLVDVVVAREVGQQGRQLQQDAVNNPLQRQPACRAVFQQLHVFRVREHLELLEGLPPFHTATHGGHCKHTINGSQRNNKHVVERFIS